MALPSNRVYIEPPATLTATLTECHFIENLGMGVYTEHLMLTRRELLIKYLRAIRKRVIWDNIDKAVVTEFVNEELSKLLRNA
jgi:hypothetical protein